MAEITVATAHPLAEWSPDHIHPKGTATDSSVWPAFNQRLYELIPAPQVRLLDLGCAGGGLVASVIAGGGTAVGIDGSDYSLRRQRAEWGRIPGNLLTADITEWFRVCEDGRPASFNVVTMWEVLEHIPESRLGAVLANVAAHLEPHGMLICSVSTVADEWEDWSYHVTVHGRDWWVKTLHDMGWREREDLFAHFDPEWVRGPGRGMASFALAVSR